MAPSGWGRTLISRRSLLTGRAGRRSSIFPDDANTTPIEIDFADGFPLGLPDLIGFTDVQFTPAAPVAAPEERLPGMGVILLVR